MNVHAWTPITRDFIRLEGIEVDGAPVEIADLQAALVPVSGSLGATGWVDPTEDTDGTPQVLVAGAAADPAGAVVIDSPVELHAKVTKNGTTVTAKLALIIYG